MADYKLKNKKNVEGNWFVTDPDADDQGCICCGVCYTNAPEFFADDDGAAYVCKQPQTQGEIALCAEQRANCPVEAIGTVS